MPEKPHRRLRPSRATVTGPVSAAGLTPLIIAGLEAAGVTVTPMLAGAIGPAVAFVFAWMTRGGRKGEPE